VSVQSTQRTLTEHAANPEAFAAKYAELKARNVKELDRFLMTAAKVLTGAPLRPRARTPPQKSAPARREALLRLSARTLCRWPL
jgi:hypothetical protein